jgi:hypothetical protein
VRIPTFSRQTGTDTDEPTTVATGSNTTPVRPRHEEPTREERTQDLRRDEPTLTDGRPVRDERPTAVRPPERVEDKTAVRVEEKTPVIAGPKPRASMLATLGLILGVGGALLVLSGPLMGYGIGVSVLALILSLGGISATSKRHVAGRLDAVLGMLLALAAIVVGVLALTGSLSWLGTDMHPVDSARQWLDAQFVNRF